MQISANETNVFCESCFDNYDQRKCIRSYQELLRSEQNQKPGRSNRKGAETVFEHGKSGAAYFFSKKGTGDILFSAKNHGGPNSKKIWGLKLFPALHRNMGKRLFLIAYITRQRLFPSNSTHFSLFPISEIYGSIIIMEVWLYAPDFHSVLKIGKIFMQQTNI